MKNKNGSNRYFIKLLTMLISISFMLSFSVKAYDVSLEQNDKKQIDAVLTTFHHAAAKAQFDLYFAQLSEQAIFLGTDGQERWTKQEFKNYVKPYFDKGRGWEYQPTVRNISDTAHNKVKIFDELLSNDNYGDCRGSGVMVLTPNGWKIAQYNLSIPVPNAIAKQVVETIEQHQALTSKAESKPKITNKVNEG